MHAVEDLTAALLAVQHQSEQTRQHNARIAAELAEVVRKQNQHNDATFGALSRTIEDLRDEVRDLRRGPR